MRSDEDRSANLRSAWLGPTPGLRPDLIHRPGVGTSLREGWCHDLPKVRGFSFVESYSFVRPRRPFLRPDLRRAGAPRGGAVKDGLLSAWRRRATAAGGAQRP